MTKNDKASVRTRTAFAVLTAVASLFGFAGCHSSYQGFQYSHGLDSYIARKRASIQAWYLWMQCRDQCCCERVCDYRRGFIEGYCNVAMGGDGCAPVVPAARYWGWRYQDASGGECVAAWYEGYPVGVAAALQVGTHYEIQTIVPDSDEYDEFQREFYNSYDHTTPTADPILPEAAPPLAPAYEPEVPTPIETAPEAVIPAPIETAPEAGRPAPIETAPEAGVPAPIGVDTDDFIDAPVVPSTESNTTTATEATFDDDLLESLNALERETLDRASR